MRLFSDFSDYYDHWFSGRGMSFRRFSSTKVHRERDHDYLEAAGFLVPWRGYAWVLDWPPGTPCVAYVQPNKHQGMGKIKMTLAAARSTWGNVYVSEWVAGACGGISTSWRLLMVGRRPFWIRYTSSDWRSNVNPLVVEEAEPPITDEDYGCYVRQALSLRSPLVAVDFVVGSDRRWYAIDLNTAPGCAPIKGILEPKEAVRLLEDRYEEIRCAY